MAGHKKWRDIKRKRDSNMSNALRWARDRGLECEQDLMAETLRQLYKINLIGAVRLGVLSAIAVILAFR